MSKRFATILFQCRRQRAWIVFDLRVLLWWLLSYEQLAQPYAWWCDDTSCLASFVQKQNGSTSGREARPHAEGCVGRSLSLPESMDSPAQARRKERSRTRYATQFVGSVAWQISKGGYAPNAFLNQTKVAMPLSTPALTFELLQHSVKGGLGLGSSSRTKVSV